jgi:hypothetical protein
MHIKAAVSDPASPACARTTGPAAEFSGASITGLLRKACSCLGDSTATRSFHWKKIPTIVPRYPTHSTYHSARSLVILNPWLNESCIGPLIWNLAGPNS